MLGLKKWKWQPSTVYEEPTNVNKAFSIYNLGQLQVWKPLQRNLPDNPKISEIEGKQLRTKLIKSEKEIKKMRFEKRRHALLPQGTKLRDVSYKQAASSFTIRLWLWQRCLNIDRLCPCFPEQKSSRRGWNYSKLSMGMLFIPCQFGLKKWRWHFGESQLAI